MNKSDGRSKVCTQLSCGGNWVRPYELAKVEAATLAYCCVPPQLTWACVMRIRYMYYSSAYSSIVVVSRHPLLKNQQLSYSPSAAAAFAKPSPSSS